MIREIVQLDKYEYDNLVRKAKMNEKEIIAEAYKLWKTKGTSRLEVTFSVRNSYDGEHSLCSSVYLFADEHFKWPDKAKKQIEEETKTIVDEYAKFRFGDINSLRKYMKEKEKRSHRRLLWMGLLVLLAWIIDFIRILS